jgi:hypothetical protein
MDIHDIILNIFELTRAKNKISRGSTYGSSNIFGTNPPKSPSQHRGYFKNILGAQAP